MARREGFVVAAVRSIALDRELQGLDENLGNDLSANDVASDVRGFLVADGSADAVGGESGRRLERKLPDGVTRLEKTGRNVEAVVNALSIPWRRRDGDERGVTHHLCGVEAEEVFEVPGRKLEEVAGFNRRSRRLNRPNALFRGSDLIGCWQHQGARRLVGGRDWCRLLCSCRGSKRADDHT
jgi:hypothetical protein